jgi:tetrahydromethanopterin S-methyltransferase subunit G
MNDPLEPQLPPSDVTPGLVASERIEWREAMRRIEELQEKVKMIRQDLQDFAGS